MAMKYYKEFNKHSLLPYNLPLYTQSTITCSKLIIETVEQGVKYVNNKDSRARPEICSKLTIKTPERRQ